MLFCLFQTLPRGRNPISYNFLLSFLIALGLKLGMMGALVRALSWDAFVFVDVAYSSCLSEYFCYIPEELCL